MAKYHKLDRLGMENTLKALEEISELNEGLFEIFYHRYFYKLVEKAKSPKWIVITQNTLDILTEAY